MSELTTVDVKAFQRVLSDYYEAHGRHALPWRLTETDGNIDPYKILVSEVMLQQTQVPRVIPKFHEFLERFPNVQTLAGASLAEVLKVWSGLGYNRRAKFLWQTARGIVDKFGSTFPRDIRSLQTLPGIGPSTAGAIVVYAFNQPQLFIETNVRTVYIYHFFKGQASISDKLISDLLGQTVDRRNPRLFYWSLMDYGSFLKKSVGNASRASKTYVRQSPFSGSRRQVRGQVLQALLDTPQTMASLQQSITDNRLAEVLAQLMHEGLIEFHDRCYQLST